jgi:hypothetical protein
MALSRSGSNELLEGEFCGEGMNELAEFSTTILDAIERGGDSSANTRTYKRQQLVASSVVP